MPQSLISDMDNPVQELINAIYIAKHEYILLGRMAKHTKRLHTSFAVHGGSTKESISHVASIDVDLSNYAWHMATIIADALWEPIESSLLDLFTEFDHTCNPNPDDLIRKITSVDVLSGHFQSNATRMSLILNHEQTKRWVGLFDMGNPETTAAKAYLLREENRLGAFYIGTWKGIDVYGYNLLADKPGALIVEGASILFSADAGENYSPSIEFTANPISPIAYSFSAKCTYNRNIVPSLGIRIT